MSWSAASPAVCRLLPGSVPARLGSAMLRVALAGFGPQVTRHRRASSSGGAAGARGLAPLACACGAACACAASRSARPGCRSIIRRAPCAAARPSAASRAGACRAGARAAVSLSGLAARSALCAPARRARCAFFGDFWESFTERILVCGHGGAVCADPPRRRESLGDEKMAACS